MAPRRVMPLLLAALLLAALPRAAQAVAAVDPSAIAPVAAVAVAAGPVPSAVAGQGAMAPANAVATVAQAPADGVSAWVQPGSTSAGGVQQFGIWTPGRLAQVAVAVFLLVLVCFFMIVRCGRRADSADSTDSAGGCQCADSPRPPRPSCAPPALRAPRSSRQMAANWENEIHSEEWRPFAKAGKNYATVRPLGDDDNPWREGRRAHPSRVRAGAARRRMLRVHAACVTAADAACGAGHACAAPLCSGLMPTKAGGYAPNSPALPPLISSQSKQAPEDWDKLPSWA
jgi:hypothetical protein